MTPELFVVQVQEQLRRDIADRKEFISELRELYQDNGDGVLSVSADSYAELRARYPALKSLPDLEDDLALLNAVVYGG